MVFKYLNIYSICGLLLCMLWSSFSPSKWLVNCPNTIYWTYFFILFDFTETKEKPKEEPEIPAILNEIHPENDVYSYALF